MYPLNTVYGQFRQKSFDEARKKFKEVRRAVESSNVDVTHACSGLSNSPLHCTAGPISSDASQAPSDVFVFPQFDVLPEEEPEHESVDSHPIQATTKSCDATNREETTEEETRELAIVSGRRVMLCRSTELLGRGSLSTVYGGSLYVEDYDEGRPVDFNNFKWRVACKEMRLPCTSRTVAFLSTLLDVRISIHHNYLLENLYLRIGEVDDTKDPPVLQCMMINERAFEGSVKDMLRVQEKLSEGQIRSIARDALLGLQYFHLVGIVHNDVKPHNLLVCREDHFRNCGQRRFKVADLTSVSFASTLDDVVSRLKHMPQKVLNSSSTLYLPGTAIYMSPESCLGMSDCTANDIWSFGITMFHLATGHLPWTAIEAAHPCMIVNGYRAKYAAGAIVPFDGPAPALLEGRKENDLERISSFKPILSDLETNDSFSHAFRDFVLSCLKEDPSQRSHCSDLLKHPFMKQ